MTDTLGPGSAGALSVQLARGPGLVNTPIAPYTWFGNCTNPETNDGTEITAEWLNAVTAQFRSAISGSGAPEDNADVMLLRAIRSNRANFIGVGGTANVLTMTPTPAFASFADLDGVPLRAVIPSAPTAQPTLSVSGLPAKLVINPDGSAIRAGQWAAVRFIEFTYLNAFDAFVAVSPDAPGIAIPSSQDVFVFATAGAANWTPPAGWRRFRAKLWGGGGSGGGSWHGGGATGPAGGGGGGGYCQRDFIAQPRSYNYVVGAGQTGGAAGNDGLTGGTSTFDSVMSATGGLGGTWPGSVGGGFGGVAGSGAGGDLNITGQIGGGWNPYTTLPNGIGGSGGGAAFGGLGGHGNYASGGAGMWPGGGGSGRGGNNQGAGSASAAGGLIIERLA